MVSDLYEEYALTKGPGCKRVIFRGYGGGGSGAEARGREGGGERGHTDEHSLRAHSFHDHLGVQLLQVLLLVSMGENTKQAEGKET